MIPSPQIVATVIIGKGGGLSAICGDITVKSLAKKLQKPRAVAANNVGNTSTLAKYTKLNAHTIPTLISPRKIGTKDW